MGGDAEPALVVQTPPLTDGERPSCLWRAPRRDGVENTHCTLFSATRLPCPLCPVPCPLCHVRHVAHDTGHIPQVFRARGFASPDCSGFASRIRLVRSRDPPDDPAD